MTKEIEIARKILKRFLEHSGSPICHHCPGTHKRPYLDCGIGNHMCLRICGAAWPELIGTLNGYVECPCHAWGPEEAVKRLVEFVGN